MITMHSRKLFQAQSASNLEPFRFEGFKNILFNNLAEFIYKQALLVIRYFCLACLHLNQTILEQSRHCLLIYKYHLAT